MAVAAKHLLDHRSFRRLYLDTRWIARPIRMHPIAIGWSGPGEQDTGPQFHLSPPSHAFRNQRTFIFCHGTAYLQQEVVMGVLADGPIEKVDLASRALELVQEHHVMDIVAGESIGAQHQHTVDNALTELVPKAIKPRTVERCPTIAIVAEDMLTAQLLACTFEMGSKPLDLLVDGVSQGLTVGRHADRDGCCHD
jgi:hypothetical protein